MKEKRLQNICKEILSYIERKDDINEEQIYRLGEGLSFYDGYEKMPIAYIKLLDAIGQKWQYQQVDDLSTVQAFVYGGLWGCMQAMEMKRRRIRTEESRQQHWNVLVGKCKEKRNLLGTIQSNPGIRHKDLAEKAKISPSSLSQSMTSMIRDGVVVCNYAGREKFYFLTEVGRKLTDELVRQEKKDKAIGDKYHNDEETRECGGKKYQQTFYILDKQWEKNSFCNVEDNLEQEREEDELICQEKEPILLNG